MLEAALGLASLREGWRRRGWELEIATCAEDIDLSPYGISRGACIDPRLMQRLWPDDARLMHYLRTGRILRDGMAPLPSPPAPPDLKDPSQRRSCLCMRSRDIGGPSTCPHLCAYCYANASRKAVMASIRSRDPLSPSL